MMCCCCCCCCVPLWRHEISLEFDLLNANRFGLFLFTFFLLLLLFPFYSHQSQTHHQCDGPSHRILIWHIDFTVLGQSKFRSNGKNVQVHSGWIRSLKVDAEKCVRCCCCWWCWSWCCPQTGKKESQTNSFAKWWIMKWKKFEVRWKQKCCQGHAAASNEPMEMVSLLKQRGKKCGWKKKKSKPSTYSRHDNTFYRPTQ